MVWRDDLRKSMDVFDQLIKPMLPLILSSDVDFVRTEGTDEEIAKLLDQQIGIDGMVKVGNLYFGLGSRIQINSGVWNTFTIRCGRESDHITELEKLKNAIKCDSLRPQLTMHAYVTDNELKSIGIVRTKSLIDYIEYNPNEVIERRSYDKKGWAMFKVAYWQKMIDLGYPVRAFEVRDGHFVRFQKKAA